ncbi:hypothetical protein AGMMS50229_05050 [Campylobacterota bacterium]|nr:hypothetical protein AGMMS50229_05050 [Campylobacterota bacterium]
MSCDCENTGSLFGLNGISGMLIAVVLLLSIIGVLTTLGIITQQASARNPYVVSGAIGKPVNIDQVRLNLKDVGGGTSLFDANAAKNAFKDAN